MVQRSRLAPPSDALSLRRERRGGPPRPARAASRHALLAVFFAGAACALPGLVGPGEVRDLAGAVSASASAAGGWARAALVAAFESIPVR